MTYHKLYNVLRQLSAILTQALRSDTHPWLKVVYVGISVILAPTVGSRVALLRFRNTEIIPKQTLQTVC